VKAGYRNLIITNHGLDPLTVDIEIKNWNVPCLLVLLDVSWIAFDGGTQKPFLSIVGSSLIKIKGNLKMPVANGIAKFRLKLHIIHLKLSHSA